MQEKVHLTPSTRSRRPPIALVVALTALTALHGCSPAGSDEIALATRCMRASDDNRAKLAATWLSNAEIEVSGDLITVRTEVPVGIGIDATVKFRHWIYRCRRRGDDIEFIGYERAR